MAFEAAFIILQAVFGLALFLGYGLGKLRDVSGTMDMTAHMGFGRLAGAYATVAEGVASVLVALAVFPRLMAAVVALNMLGALTFHWKNRDGFKGGWESAFLYFTAFVAIVVGGYSPWGLMLG